MIDEDLQSPTKRRRITSATSVKTEPSSPPPAVAVPLPTIPIASLPTPLVHDIKIQYFVTAKVDVRLSIGPDNRIHLVNHHDVNVTVPAGVVLAGYYSGKWWSPAKSKDQAETSADLRFKLDGPDSLVWYESSLKTVKDLILEKEASLPDLRF